MNLPVPTVAAGAGPRSASWRWRSWIRFFRLVRLASFRAAAGMPSRLPIWSGWLRIMRCCCSSVRLFHQALTLFGSVPAAGACWSAFAASVSAFAVAESRPVPLLALVARWASRALMVWSAWSASLRAAVIRSWICLACSSASLPAKFAELGSLSQVIPPSGATVILWVLASSRALIRCAWAAAKPS